MPTIAEAIRPPPSPPPVRPVADHLAAVLLDLRQAGIPPTILHVLAQAREQGLPTHTITAIAERFRGTP